MHLFLALLGGALFLVLLDIRAEFGNPVAQSAGGGQNASQEGTEKKDHVLFRGDNFPLNGLVIVWAPTCWAEPIHIRPDIVEAKLAYLEVGVSTTVGSLAGAESRSPYLIPTWTRSEVPV